MPGRAQNVALLCACLAVPAAAQSAVGSGDARSGAQSSAASTIVPVETPDVLPELWALTTAGGIVPVDGVPFPSNIRFVASDDSPAILTTEGKSAYLGVQLAPVGDNLARHLKLDGRKGALVLDVVADGPAAKAGLQEGDVIVGIDGKSVASAAELRTSLSEMKAGQQVAVEVVRNGKRQHLNVTLGERTAIFWQGRLGEGELFDGKQFKELGKLKDFKFEVPPGTFKVRPFPKQFMQIDPKTFSFGSDRLFFGMNRPRLGVSVLPITDQLREYFRVDAGKGVLVSSVVKDSPADKAGLKAGDIIVAVDGKNVADVGDITQTLAAKGDGTHSIQVEIVRDRSHQVLTATVEKKTDEE